MMMKKIASNAFGEISKYCHISEVVYVGFSATETVYCVAQQFIQLKCRNGSKASFRGSGYVRFTPESDRDNTLPGGR
jgi:hypothetical protein